MQDRLSVDSCVLDSCMISRQRVHCFTILLASSVSKRRCPSLIGDCLSYKFRARAALGARYGQISWQAQHLEHVMIALMWPAQHFQQLRII